MDIVGVLTQVLGKSVLDMATHIGLPKINIQLPSVKFSVKEEDPLSLGVSDWTVRIRAFWDRFRGVGCSGDLPTGFEHKIIAIRNKIITDVEIEKSHFKKDVASAMHIAEKLTIETESAEEAARSLFKVWVNDHIDRRKQLRQRYEVCLKAASESGERLSQYVSAKSIVCERPKVHVPAAVVFSSLVVAIFVEGVFGFSMLAGKRDISLLSAGLVSALGCFFNIAVGYIAGAKLFPLVEVANSRIKKAVYSGVCVSFVMLVMLTDVAYAYWRDSGHSMSGWVVPYVDLSALSLMLLGINIAVFVAMSVDFFQRSSDCQRNHRELWKQSRDSKNELDMVKVEYDRLLNQMRLGQLSLSNLIVETANKSIAAIKEQIVRFENLMSELNIMWPNYAKLCNNIEEATKGHIVAYRETLCAKRASVEVPTFPSNEIDLSCGDEILYATEAIAQLKKCEQAAVKLVVHVEKNIVPHIQEIIDEEAKIEISQCAIAESGAK